MSRNLNSSEVAPSKPTQYIDTYTPSLLYSIERAESRELMGLTGALPFGGEDVWNAFEFTWLDSGGKPQAAAVRINVPCSSPCMVESKSLKLYLNSFAMSRFSNKADILSTLNSDLALVFRAPVMVNLLELDQIPEQVDRLPGTCLDGLNVEVESYERAPQLLLLEDGEERAVKETLHTNLFRSLCPVTSQPDFATLVIQYLGRPIFRTGLLRYLISYRSHQGFHEDTVEQIFVDLLEKCRPEQLSVAGYFLRRGGIDINPYRSNVDEQAPALRLPRQ